MKTILAKAFPLLVAVVLGAGLCACSDDDDDDSPYSGQAIGAINGHVFLFDTKSRGSDKDAPQKHNALLDYMASPENRDKRLAGGVLIWDGYNWKYSTAKITNTDDTTNWTSFFNIFAGERNIQ